MKSLCLSFCLGRNLPLFIYCFGRPLKCLPSHLPPTRCTCTRLLLACHLPNLLGISISCFFLDTYRYATYTTYEAWKRDLPVNIQHTSPCYFSKYSLVNIFPDSSSDSPVKYLQLKVQSIFKKKKKQQQQQKQQHKTITIKPWRSPNS